MFEKFAASARLTVFFARYEAMTSGCPDIQPCHFAVAIRCLFREMPCAGQAAAPFLPSTSGDSRKDLPLSDGSKRVLQSAAAYARDLWSSDVALRRILPWFSASGEWFVDARHILLALTRERGSAIEELKVQLFGPDGVQATATAPSALSDFAIGKQTGKLGVALLCANYESRRLTTGAIRPEDLLLGLVFGTTYPSAPQSAGQPFGSIAMLRNEIFTDCQAAGEPDTVSPEAQQVLGFAAAEAASLGHQSVGTAHLLLGLLRMEDCFPAAYLRRRGIEISTVRTTLAGADLP